MDNQPLGSDQFHKQFNLMRKTYAQRLLTNTQDIAKTWQQVTNDALQPEILQSLMHKIHNVAGSAATFGFTEVGWTAQTLSDLLRAVLENGQLLSHEQHTQISVLVDALFAASTNVTTADTQPTDYYGHIGVLFEPQPQPVATPVDDDQLIFLVESNQLFAEDLALQIEHFGYKVQLVIHPDTLLATFEQQTPAAIVMDVLQLSPARIDTARAQQRQHELLLHIPTLFISADDTIQARLQAVRAGGKAFFTKPVNVNMLIDKLDALTNRHTPEPYRILIVDDDLPIATYYESLLQQVGMVTYALTNPLEVLPLLDEFTPDLILMDVYMPMCSGLEIAAVIRQQETYIGLPIVFLSAETRLDRQMRALQQGGDDFLTKPIQADHLIAAIVSRIKRSRVLRASMVRDGLTGLFNHTTIKEQLEREVALARRRTQPVSLAMLDLDHFKTINDTYGHNIGDRVIKSVARVLQQRLRSTDIVGRYGGEEFAVIMLDTEGPQAARVLDDIRQRFAHIRQHADNQTFQATFSGGVASFPFYASAGLLTKAADMALYTAKRQQRNQIVLADQYVNRG